MGGVVNMYGQKSTFSFDRKVDENGTVVITLVMTELSGGDVREFVFTLGEHTAPFSVDWREDK
jgi:hypothetical protein